MNVILEQLKSLPTICSLSQKETYSFSKFPMGIPKSGLVEFKGDLGSGKTEFLLQFLTENSDLSVAWVEKPFTLFPLSFFHYQLDIQRFLFLDLDSPKLKRSTLFCVSQLLRSQMFPVIILSDLTLNNSELRHLQLATKKAGTLIIFLSSKLCSYKSSWPFTLQLHLKRTNSFSSPAYTIIRNKI
jgi:hypothetical protein